MVHIPQKNVLTSFKKSKKRSHSCRGFSLVELAIVLGIMASVIGGIWAYSIQVQRNASVTQSVQVINSLVDAVRADYANQASITGGVSIVTPYIISMGAMPTSLLHTTPSVCGATPATTYADSPFSNNTATGDTCGTLRVCGWQMQANYGQCRIGPAPTTGVQTFAIEFMYLDAPSCLALVTQITSTSPASGLQDIFINGTSASVTNGGPLPISIANATPLCQNLINALTPTAIDFIYSLRAPTT